MSEDSIPLPDRASLARRAVLAVVLLIAFYGLALAIALGLLWIPYAQWLMTDRVYFKLLVRQRLAEDPSEAARWTAFCAATGIAEVDLGRLGLESASASPPA